MKFSSFLVLYWLATGVPLVIMSFAHSYWALLIPHLILCIGGAGYHPASGELLKSMYADKVRGRIYGILFAVTVGVAALVNNFFGEWLTADPMAHAKYLLIIAAAQAVGVAMLSWLGSVSGLCAERRERLRLAPPEPFSVSRLLEPIAHMRTVLKQDPIFARYEGAYMTYGVGWMIAYALLPILVTAKHNLPYDQSMQSTFVPYLLAMLVTLVPAGFLMDRFGAIRTVGLSFFLLMVHPLGMLFAPDVGWLIVASAAYGVAHAGASVGWMLGPVSLAPSSEKVPHYVAIHATLVGVRGILFQFAGIALYELTKSFTAPLILAAAAYLWSSIQMWQLDRRMKAAKVPSAANAAPSST